MHTAEHSIVPPESHLVDVNVHSPPLEPVTSQAQPEPEPTQLAFEREQNSWTPITLG